MASVRELRGRIATLKNIEKITRAVKMISVVKMRRAQERVLSLRPYATAMRRLLADLIANDESLQNPLITPREKKNAAVVVITSDRGLCGAFNTNLVKLGAQHATELAQTIPQGGVVKLFCVGKKSNEFYTRRNYAIAGQYPGLFQDLQFDSAQEITRQVVEGYLRGKYDSVDIIYSEFLSLTRQRNTIERMLPVPISEQKAEHDMPAKQISSATKDVKKDVAINYIFEPNVKEIFERLLPQSLNLQMWNALLASNASEHSARMVAMDNATKNAGELITGLSLVYNKARQSAITKEILEIVSGAEALRGGA